MEELKKVTPEDQENFRKHYEHINQAFGKLIEKDGPKQKSAHSYRSKVYYISRKP